MPLGRILPRPSGTVPTQLVCATRTWPSLARLGLSQRNAHGLAQLGRRERARGAGASAHDGAACGGTASARGCAACVRCSGDLTGAWEAAGEITAGPHRRMDGGAAELVA
jgi:hypothetical protein